VYASGGICVLVFAECMMCVNTCTSVHSCSLVVVVVVDDDVDVVVDVADVVAVGVVVACVV
jgi:hypothetical protein